MFLRRFNNTNLRVLARKNKQTNEITTTVFEIQRDRNVRTFNKHYRRCFPVTVTEHIAE